MDTNALWKFLLWGYATSVAIETPVLLAGLARVHPVGRRLFAGLWLTACTYPIVVLVLPILLDSDNHRALYLTVAETFAPAAECALFGLAYHRGANLPLRVRVQDYAVVTAANLASFLLGEWLQRIGL